jgi:site-specific recombinase XerD
MDEILKSYIKEKYKEKLMYLVSLNNKTRPLPQQTVYNVLKDLIDEFVNKAKIRPYKELLIRIEDLLDTYKINYKKLTYNNFYMFLKRNNIINKTDTTETNKKEKNKKDKKYFKTLDPVDSLTKI